MRRVKTKPTASEYMTRLVILFLLLITIGMTVLILYTTNQAVQDSAKRTLGIDAGRFGRNIVKDENGQYRLSTNMQPRTEDCAVVLLTEDGEVVDGEYPADMKMLKDVPLLPEDERFHSVSSDEGKIYVYDYRIRYHHRERITDGGAGTGTGSGSGSGTGTGSGPGTGSGTGTGSGPGTGSGSGAGTGTGSEVGIGFTTSDPDSPQLYTRAMLSANDMDTIYHDVRKLYFIMLVVILIIIGCGGAWLYRITSKPLREMCEQVSQLSDDTHFSKHVEDPGYFYETEVFSQAYNNLVERAGQMVKQHEEFNGNVSHELRTPVALIHSECELIEDLYMDQIPPEVSEAVGVIQKQSEKMGGIISELLYLARINRDTYKLNKELVDLADLAESSYEEAEDLYGTSRNFICRTEPAIAAIDVSLMMIAVHNLSSNALKYSAAGSTIEFTTGCTDGNAFLKVRDEGIGIPEEHLDRIFEPYYQVEDGRNKQGVGLGLSLVKKIVEKHDGSVEVSSAPGKGSTFTIYLPATNP